MGKIYLDDIIEETHGAPPESLIIIDYNWIIISRFFRHGAMDWGNRLSHPAQKSTEAHMRPP